MIPPTSASFKTCWTPPHTEGTCATGTVRGERNETREPARRHKRLGVPTVLPRCGAGRLQTRRPGWRKCRPEAPRRGSECGELDRRLQGREEARGSRAEPRGRLLDGSWHAYW